LNYLTASGKLVVEVLDFPLRFHQVDDDDVSYNGDRGTDDHEFGVQFNSILG
jgi:hypothetical protein